jgi:hypothetical protein
MKRPTVAVTAATLVTMTSRTHPGDPKLQELATVRSAG